MSEAVYVPKPKVLSKTYWSVGIAVLSVVCGFFGVSTEWLVDIAALLNLTPAQLTAVTIAAINLALKGITWVWYKWIAKKED